MPFVRTTPSFQRVGKFVMGGSHISTGRDLHRAHNWSPEFIEARRQSVSLPHDSTPDLAGIQAPVRLIHGRYDRMVPFELSAAILDHIADSRLVLLNNCGHWPPFEKRPSGPRGYSRSCRATERDG